MQYPYHLELHNLEHRQLARQAELERRANAERQPNDQPNPVRKHIGVLLVEVGERLQEPDRRAQVSPAR